MKHDTCKKQLPQGSHGENELDMLKKYLDIQCIQKGFPGGSDSKESAMQETWVQSLGLEEPLEKGMATHSSIPAWRIPWTEETGGL